MREKRSITPYFTLPATAALGRAFQVILSVILRRLLDPEALARLTIGQTLYTYLDLSHLGIRSALTREIPGAEPEKRPGLTSSAALGILIAGALAALLATAGILLFLPSDPLLRAMCVSWTALFLPLSSVALVRALLRSLGDTSRLAILNFWQGLAITLFSLALMPFMKVWGYVAGTLLGNIILLPVLFPGIPQGLGLTGQKDGPIPGFSGLRAWYGSLPSPGEFLENLKSLARVGLPMLGTEMASVLSLTVDRWIILALLGNRQLGLWASGALFLSLATVAPSAFSEIMLPRIMELLRGLREKGGDISALRKQWLRAALWQFAGGIAIALIAIPLIAPFVMTLFPAYAEAIPAARLLMAQTPFLCLTAASSCLLVAMGRLFIPGILNLLFSLITVLGCFLTPVASLSQAAWVMLAARGLVALLFMLFALGSMKSGKDSTTGVPTEGETHIIPSEAPEQPCSTKGAPLLFTARLCLGLACLSTPLVALQVFTLSGKSIVVPHLAWLPAAFLGFALLFRHLQWTFQPPDLFFLAFAGWGLGSSLLESFLNTGSNSGIRPFTQFGYMMLMLLGCKGLQFLFDYCRRRGWDLIPLTARLLLAAALGSALLALGQYGLFHLRGQVLDLARNANIYALYVPNSLDGGMGPGLFSALPGARAFRAFATFPEPTFLAHFLTIGLFLIPLASGRKGFMAASALLLLGGLIVTLSRTGWFATLGGGLVLLWLSGRSRAAGGRARWIFLPLLALALAGGTALINPERLVTFDDLSLKHRLGTLSTSLRAVMDRPAGGHGLGSSDRVSVAYMEQGPGRGFRRGGLNSLYPQILMETGIGGLTLFLLFLIFLFRSTEDPWLAAALAATFLYWLGHSALNWTFLWILISMASQPARHRAGTATTHLDINSTRN